MTQNDEACVHGVVTPAQGKCAQCENNPVAWQNGYDDAMCDGIDTSSEMPCTCAACLKAYDDGKEAAFQELFAGKKAARPDTDVAILVYRWEDAPQQWKALSTRGGDEDWLAFVPENMKSYIPFLEKGLPFLEASSVRFGNSVDRHEVMGGVILISSHATASQLGLLHVHSKPADNLLPCGHHRDALLDDGNEQWCGACEITSARQGVQDDICEKSADGHHHYHQDFEFGHGVVFECVCGKRRQQKGGSVET